MVFDTPIKPFQLFSSTATALGITTFCCSGHPVTHPREGGFHHVGLVFGALKRAAFKNTPLIGLIGVSLVRSTPVGWSLRGEFS